MRQKVRPNLDKKIFRNTAVATKKINISPVIYRGGIRM